MASATRNNVDWRRHHDPKAFVIKPGSTIHAISDAPGFVTACLNNPLGTRLTTSGSHWSLSTGTVSDSEWLETNWPDGPGLPANTGLADIDLADIIHDALFDELASNPVVPPDQLTEDPCLSDELHHHFFVHLKSGTRIYEGYRLLDASTPGEWSPLARRLNEKLTGDANTGPYAGPWGFETLGGAGGQTVVGAATTGTHGGDYRQRPVADSIVALHLVSSSGKHYWIESSEPQFGFQLTDDDKLTAAYAGLHPSAEFEIIRDDEIFRAVLIGAGRFGAVTSVVLRIVPQYSLHEHRRIDSWNRVKTALRSPAGHNTFDGVHFAGTPKQIDEDRQRFNDRFGHQGEITNRFLQIAVHLSPDGNGDHPVGITQRWFYPPAGGEAFDPNGELRGRPERGTLATAGTSGSYVPPDDDTGAGGNTTFLSRACASGNFVAGALREVADEIEQIIADGAAPALGIAVAALGIGAGVAALTVAGLCAVLVAIVVLIRALADAIDAQGDVSLAQVVDMGTQMATGIPGIPDEIGIMAIRTVFYQVFMGQQSNRDYIAVSYAVMDGHDYLDRSCYGNAESIEVFFDADRPDRYCAYVDAVLSFEAFQQEQRLKFSVGYVSLRYIQGSGGLIAPSRHANTVVVEVAAIRDASGSVDFVMNAARLAQNPNFDATFHWGQFNPMTRAAVENRYGSRLDRWRDALVRITGDGDLDTFSNDFTRQTGLEA